MKLSPSACNAQPYFYYMVSGDEAKNVRNLLQLGKMNSFAKDVNAFAIVTEENYNLSAKISSSVKDQDYKSPVIFFLILNFKNSKTLRCIPRLSG